MRARLHHPKGGSFWRRQAAHRPHRPFVHGILLVLIAVVAGYAAFAAGEFPGQSSAFAAPVTGLSMPAVSPGAPAVQASVLHPLTINRTVRAEPVIAPQQQEEAAQFSALAVSATETAEPESTDDAISREAAAPPPPQLPPYQVYRVQEGDTVSSIAARFGIDPAYIVANNIEIQDSDFLTLGQSIIIPAGNGILHEVRLGETLSDIATRYNVTVEDIAAFRANDISAPDAIVEAQLLFVPGGAIPAPPQLATAEPGPDGAPASAPPPAAAGPSSSLGLIWPFVGPISSYYGAGHPLGIDIDGFNAPGAPIVAATSGTVVFAGGNACCSYGLYVVIVSPDGIETLYAHLSSISVVQGQTVTQGEVIGYIGATGYSTGVHLHFEVIDNGVRVDPLAYLP